MSTGKELGSQPAYPQTEVSSLDGKGFTKREVIMKDVMAAMIIAGLDKTIVEVHLVAAITTFTNLLLDEMAENIEETWRKP